MRNIKTRSRGAQFLFGIALVLTIAPAFGQIQDIKYGVGKWDPETGLGNHRAVVRIEAPPAPVPTQPDKAVRKLRKRIGPPVPPAALVRIGWRRRDAEPEKKNVIVIDAATGERVLKIVPVRIDKETGEFLLEPKTVPGDYYFYFMPYRSEGRKNYPNVRYDPPAWSSDPDLAMRAAGIYSSDLETSIKAHENLLKAEVVELQSADAFSAFTPMEVIATFAERQALLDAHPGAPYLLFPEDRSLSIRMADDLPARWALEGPTGTVKGEAARGEYFTFQLGLWAARQGIADVEVRFSDLKLAGPAAGGSGSPAPPDTIPAEGMTCFAKGGVGWDGLPFKKAVSVALGKVQALWCGIKVPVETDPGLYKGTITMAPAGLPETILAVDLKVADTVLADGGDADPYRMTRLRWLDSTLAQDDEIVPPYTPMTVDRFTVGCLGRTLAIGRDGFPALIRSYFAPEMTGLRAKPVPVTALPLRLVVTDEGGRDLAWEPSLTGPRLGRRGPGAVAWEADNCNGDFLMRVEARMEFDGFVDYRVALTARRDLAVKDIRLEVPWSGEAADYMMGLGFKGGLRPPSFAWTWDPKNNQDALWIGAVHAGMQVGLRAENYSRPLNTNFYLSKPLNMPPSWWNGGKGRVRVDARDAAKPGARPGAVVMTASSGDRVVRRGEVLHFDFTLLITPFKPIRPAAHFRERYFHAFQPLDEVAAAGANVINVHHANAINPYINYPFLRPAEMKAYIDDAHRRGFKVKIYDTVRELSNRAPELFALRSLGHEIFSAGPGGGYSWLQEHLGSDYIAAWFVPELKDAAVINSGLSRWHNYYIEGLDWLARNVGIDGLYLDDVAFDRTTMKRVRKVLDRDRPGALIDLHSANQYNVRDGFASSANLYLEHFPYLDRLWFGEYFDYNGSGPDYWLVEVSGLPFGLMGEMLQDGGNPWRGVVFGMTARLPWAGDPRPLWKVWDEFGIAESAMVGWWVESNPIKTGAKDVLATCYVRKGTKQNAGSTRPELSGSAAASRTGRPGALVALASWAKEPVDVRLSIDWKALGLDPKTATIVAPAIDKFQDAASFKPGDPILIEPGKGRLLILR